MRERLKAVRVLSHAEAERFYDAFGAKQDGQAFYEDGAIEDLIDLLSDADTVRLLAEAARVLVPGGRLCLAGIAPGVRPLERVVSALWRWVYALRPSLVGGCRPVRIAPLLKDAWRPVHATAVSAWGITSEVLVAERAGSVPPTSQ